jgi:hypothetical protein
MTDKTTEDKPKKPTAAQAATLKVQELEARVAKLEKKQVIVTDGFEFAGNEVRPLYGMGALALVFDAVYNKLAE